MKAFELLQKAKSQGWALGAFNAGNLEILQAIVQAAQNLNSPLIIETSAGEARHFGIENFLDVVENFRQKTNLTILTNFDHGSDLEECQTAIEAGYNLVHFDGSFLSYEENVKTTRFLVEEAHSKGVLVEGEIDKIIGSSSYHEETMGDALLGAKYTDPARAADFVFRTGIDILAVFIGNLHGAYLQPKRLDLERLRLIKKAVEEKVSPLGKEVFFSLHGGSTIVPEDIKEAIKLGVVKINVNTELRLAFRQTLENVLRGSEEVAIYKIMPPVIAAVQKVVEEKIQLFKL